MELDDLRRQWRQPEPVAPPALTGRNLDALLKGRTLGLVEKMRRAAWFEVGFALLTTLGLLVAWLLLHKKSSLPSALTTALVLVMVLLLLVMLVYYRRLLGVLARMLEPTASVQRHLTTLAQGLRQLLSFYYRLTIWMAPAMVLLSMGYYVGQELARPGPMRWRLLASLAAGMLVVVVPAQVGIVYFTRWWVQRLYGRHLDRLEGQLRELNEDIAAD